MGLIKRGDYIIVKAAEPLGEEQREELERPIKVKQVHGNKLELENKFIIDTEESVIRGVMRLK